jgi:hypothetical protein
MIKKRKLPIGSLIYVLALIALIGYASSIISFVATGYKTEIYHHSICLTNDCVQYWSTIFEYPLLIAKSTSDLLVAFATAGGIVIALMSYIASVSTSALANHISHYSIFQEYMMNEISKRDRISLTSIDILSWYNHIFSSSRTGIMTVSKEYFSYIEKLNSQIAASNDQAKRAKDGEFRYKPHQEKIKDILSETGILVEFQPRNDFYEMEGQIFSLINGINRSFCYSDAVPALVQRKYI